MVYETPKVICVSCGAVQPKNYQPITNGHWWFFGGYVTKKGNKHQGRYCPKCSEMVYSENR